MIYPGEMSTGRRFTIRMQTLGILKNMRLFLKASMKKNGRTQRRALDILSKVGDDPVVIGKKPISVAAAALYMAALETGEYTTQLRLAVASELTTITIRKRYLEIVQILKEKSLPVPNQEIQDDSSEELPCEILQVAQPNHIQ